MIHIARAGGPVARVVTSRAGDDVVVAAFVCASMASAGQVLEQLDRQLAAASFDFTPLAEIEAEEIDVFAPGTPVRLRVYDWDSGGAAIDATVVRRISPAKLQIRTRMGQLVEAREADLRPRSAH